jgi:hypothetical protein
MHITTSSYVAYCLPKQHALRKMRRSVFGQWKQKRQVKEALLKAPLTRKWKWKIDQDIMHALYGKQNCTPGIAEGRYQCKAYHQISWSKRNSPYTDPFTTVGSWSIIGGCFRTIAGETTRCFSHLCGKIALPWETSRVLGLLMSCNKVTGGVLKRVLAILWFVINVSQA